MNDSKNDFPTFHVGITMAGAGSAGCYSGGAMDYLFEILDMWEKAKKDLLPEMEEFGELIPRHNVVIDVMGGTSAGGMTTALSAIYALSGIINPVKDPQKVGGKRDNIFYDSWVNLDDDEGEDGRKTLAKAWDTDDLDDNKIGSLLNTKIIDDIAERQITANGDLKESIENLPSYFSKNMEVLLAHTMLRGIPLGLQFSTPIGLKKKTYDIPEHNTYEHFTVSHYKLNSGIKPNEKFYLWLNPFEKPYADVLRLTAKATGAFPLGLKFREINSEAYSDEYLKNITRRIVSNRFAKEPDDKFLKFEKLMPPLNFITIDGGAINNEPFGEVLSILRNVNEQNDEMYPGYGIVMIDPFPDVADTDTPYKAPDDIFSVIPAIINTLHDQSKVKRADILEASEHPYFRGEIFPRRWVNHEPEKSPIATGSAMAFGGFLDINFRHYDFFLGRDNARNYYRYFFSFEYHKDDMDPSKNIIHPIHQSWTPEMVEIFSVPGPAKDGKIYLPIIPDLNILLEIKAGGKRGKLDYSVKERPAYDPTILFGMKEAMEDRFVRILEISKQRLETKKRKARKSETAKWMNKYFHSSLWGKIAAIFISMGIDLMFRLTKRTLAKKITSFTIQLILADLEEKQFLKKFSDR